MNACEQTILQELKQGLLHMTLVEVTSIYIAETQSKILLVVIFQVTGKCNECSYNSFTSSGVIFRKAN